MYIESYKQLEVWKRSIELVKEVYHLTEQFPKAELYGIVSQMRRAVISIPSNIAEGYKRKNLGEYLQFLSIADASAAELETQIIISKDLYLKVDFSKAESLLEEVQKMLFAMIKTLNAKRYTLNPKRYSLNPQGGFIALISVLIIGAIVLAVSIGVSLRSLGEANMSLSEELSNRALNLANGCAEVALMKLKNSLNYSGNEVIMINSDSCNILPVAGSGNFNRTIQTQSAISGYTKKVQVVVSQVNPLAQISSWSEVGGF